jgi:hypothetical protein
VCTATVQRDRGCNIIFKFGHMSCTGASLYACNPWHHGEMPSVASSADRLAFLIPPFLLLPIIESLMCVVRIHEMLNTVSTCRLICQRHKRTGVVGTVYRGELMYAQQCQFKLKCFLLSGEQTEVYRRYKRRAECASLNEY